MIKVFNTTQNKDIKFEHTKFPDGTSQVWKLHPEPENHDAITVTWMFENEAELMPVCQLGDLLVVGYAADVTLNAPFLPYSRQDKFIGNHATFALSTFISLIRMSGYDRITTYDAHSIPEGDEEFIDSETPVDFFNQVFDKESFVCFPDAGAASRYSFVNHSTNKIIIGEKKRNQVTGTIEGLSIGKGRDLVKGQSVLIFDDICDGGGTFIQMAKLLYELGATDVKLAVSHGIFSKGLDPLFDAGISVVYTTNSLLKNKEHFKVC